MNSTEDISLSNICEVPLDIKQGRSAKTGSFQVDERLNDSHTEDDKYLGVLGKQLKMRKKWMNR